MRNTIFITLLLVLLLLPIVSIAGDTGTYRIMDYKVKLTPHSDGLVQIDYYQKWNVTGGHIPWITVGTPNGNFSIIKSGNAVSKIAPVTDQSDWDGVRIDLKKDYKPGEVFEISFSIMQNKLFYANENDYKLDFTPGWYENSFIDTLQVTIKIFTKPALVKTTPKAPINNEEITWRRQNLGKGEKMSVSMSFPKNLAKIKDDNLKNDDISGATILVIFLIIVVLVVVIVVIAVNSDGGYGGGGIFYGGSGGGGYSSGGGGGFGGSSSSCACACVACACACACAGGGGAGCSRKLEHSCPQCKDKGVENEDNNDPVSSASSGSV